MFFKFIYSQQLSQMIPKSEVGVLSSDSNNVVQLIESAYNVSCFIEIFCEYSSFVYNHISSPDFVLFGEYNFLKCVIYDSGCPPK